MKRIGIYPLVEALGTNTYTATLSPAPTAYVEGQRFNVKFTNANTGPSTINFNDLGDIPLVKNGADALISGDISQDQILLLVFDGTNAQIIGGGGGVSGGWTLDGTTVLEDVVRIEYEDGPGSGSGSKVSLVFDDGIGTLTGTGPSVAQTFLFAHTPTTTDPTFYGVAALAAGSFTTGDYSTVGAYYGKAAGMAVATGGVTYQSLLIDGQDADPTNWTTKFDDTTPSPTGIQYMADYSATLVDRSLIDKGYLTKHGWSTSGVTVLDPDATLAPIIIAGLSGFEEVTIGIGNSVDNVDVLKLTLGNVVGNLFFNADNETVTFTDQRVTTKGIEYAADYSASFTDRSLADWGNVWKVKGTTTVEGDVLITSPGAATISLVTPLSNSYIAIGSEIDTGGSNYTSLISISMTHGADLVSFDFDLANQQGFGAGVKFSDFRTVKKGIEYGNNYSAGFTDRSLIDKGFVVGLQDLWMGAVGMWPRTTNGCAALAKSEIATSLVNIQTLDFDQTTQEFAQFTISLPRNWNNGTVTATIYWTAAAGSGAVVWGISGGAYSNDDVLTAALGTAVTVTDTLTAVNDVDITDATSAITLAGVPADADFLVFQISRNPSDGGDTLTADAKLLGVVITLTTDAAKAA